MATRLRRSALALAALAVGWRVEAQGVMLQIKPRVGDTLRMRLDQQTEINATKRTGLAQSAASMLTTMKMFSRAIVEANTPKGTTVLAVTDSVLVTSTDEQMRASAAKAEQQLRGQRVRFQVTPDGTVGMTPQDSAPREVSEVVALMPAAFPKGMVEVGESWIREMPLGAGAQLASTLSGKLHVTFRLDSLGHGGDWAYVSMRGEMQPASSVPTLGVVEKGMVNGSMLVDRRRGWLTDSRFTIVVTSTMSPPAVNGAIVRTQTRITQHMQTLPADKR